MLLISNTLLNSTGPTSGQCRWAAGVEEIREASLVLSLTVDGGAPMSRVGFGGGVVPKVEARRKSGQPKVETDW